MFCQKSCLYNIHRKTPALGSFFNAVPGLKAWNFIKWFFSVNIAKFLRIIILQNICERLLLIQPIQFPDMSLFLDILTIWIWPCFCVPARFTSKQNEGNGDHGYQKLEAADFSEAVVYRCFLKWFFKVF